MWVVPSESVCVHVSLSGGERYAFFFVRVHAGLYAGLSSPAEPHHRANDARDNYEDEDGGPGVEVGCKIAHQLAFPAYPTRRR